MDWSVPRAPEGPVWILPWWSHRDLDDGVMVEEVPRGDGVDPGDPSSLRC